jgi:hypothetical protein
MKNTKTNKIHELRKAGYKVKVSIKRYNSFNGDLCDLYDFKESHCPNFISPMGGYNKIELTVPDGATVIGEAYCSKLDPYNRKIGNAIALGRAMKQLNLNLAEIE